MRIRTYPGFNNFCVVTNFPPPHPAFGKHTAVFLSGLSSLLSTQPRIHDGDTKWQVRSTRLKGKVNGGNSGQWVANSGQRQFIQRIGRRWRPRRRESFLTAACSVPYRRRCRRRPIRCKNCRCPELPTVRSSPHLPYIATVCICGPIWDVSPTVGGTPLMHDARYTTKTAHTRALGHSKSICSFS